MKHSFRSKEVYCGMRRISVALLLALLCVGEVSAAQRIRLVLDWFPNVDHLPLYVARGMGLFEREGLSVELISPSETTDAVKLVASGAAEMAISYAPQVLVAASEGLPLKVVGRLVGSPLSTVLFVKGRGIQRPSDLEGKRVGYTVPGMMDVMARAFLKAAGVKGADLVHVGFQIVQPLASGAVAAVVGGFRNYEFVKMRMEGLEPGAFHLEEWGIPHYDELVFVANPSWAESHRGVVDSFRRALEASVRELDGSPERALRLYFEQLPEAPRDLEREAFAVTLPLYARSQEIEAQRWEALRDFLLREGLLRSKVDLGRILWR